jgi:hypothetical protein
VGGTALAVDATVEQLTTVMISATHLTARSFLNRGRHTTFTQDA